jgi:hypothetical protein
MCSTERTDSFPLIPNKSLVSRSVFVCTLLPPRRMASAGELNRGISEKFMTLGNGGIMVWPQVVGAGSAPGGINTCASLIFSIAAAAGTLPMKTSTYPKT